jgi:hypothetical protein
MLERIYIYNETMASCTCSDTVPPRRRIMSRGPVCRQVGSRSTRDAHHYHLRWSKLEFVNRPPVVPTTVHSSAVIYQLLDRGGNTVVHI